MQVTQQQLDTLCDIVCEAGEAVMAVYRGDCVAWEKADASPLTEADLRADAIIRSGLEAEFPGMFILSEESSSGDLVHADAFFLVDPLDGTKEFLNHNDEFTVNIALIHRGVPVAGVVLAPALGELFFAAKGLGAWKHDASSTMPLRVTATRDETSPLRVIGSRSHGGEALAAWLATLPYEHTVVTAGSSLKFCRLAEGRADIYPRFGLTSQWDTAAAQCVLELAGGAVMNMDGAPLRYGLDRPVLNSDFIAVVSAPLWRIAGKSL